MMIYRQEINGEENWFPQKYRNVEPIYIGSKNRIFKAFDSSTNKYVAIKRISNAFGNVISAKRVFREFCHLNSVSHHNIVKLIDAYTPQQSHEEFNDVYLVTELMKMNLTELSENYRLCHENISFLVYQMLCATHHLHSFSIIHRNLTPEHIVVDDKCQLKILDFGLSKNFDENSLSNTPYVVPRHFRAPEITLGLDYDKKVDIWSIGCIFGQLITGQIMFPGSNPMSQWWKIAEKLGSPNLEFLNTLPSSTRQQIERNVYEGVGWEEMFPNEVFPKTGDGKQGEIVNEMARDLLSKMLVIDPTKRITIEEALQHPYVNQWYKPEDFEIHNTRPNKFVENEKYAAIDWKNILFFELKEYERLHNNFDSNTNASIEMSDVEEFLAEHSNPTTPTTTVISNQTAHSTSINPNLGERQSSLDSNITNDSGYSGISTDQESPQNYSNFNEDFIMDIMRSEMY